MPPVRGPAVLKQTAKVLGKTSYCVTEMHFFPHRTLPFAFSRGSLYDFHPPTDISIITRPRCPDDAFYVPVITQIYIRFTSLARCMPNDQKAASTAV